MYAGHFTKKLIAFIKARAIGNSHNRNTAKKGTVNNDVYILTEKKSVDATSSLPGG